MYSEDRRKVMHNVIISSPIADIRILGKKLVEI